MSVFKQTDLAEIRAANMRVVKNKSGEYGAVDVARSSRVLIALRQLEVRLEGGARGNAGHAAAPPVFAGGEPLVDDLRHVLRVVG